MLSLAALSGLWPALPATGAEAPAVGGAAPRPRVGLVLGGGGARGAAHIGVLEVLERLRVPGDAAELGGFLNLSGYASGQLVGDSVGYAHVRAERFIGRLPLGLRGDMRLGLALEAGRVGQPYAVQKKDGWLSSVAVCLGGETPLGPVYLGLGPARWVQPPSPATAWCAASTPWSTMRCFHASVSV
jgi:hypothetical protein